MLASISLLLVDEFRRIDIDRFDETLMITRLDYPSTISALVFETDMNFSLLATIIRIDTFTDPIFSFKVSIA